jgi:hypothetical protein
VQAGPPAAGSSVGLADEGATALGPRLSPTPYGLMLNRVNFPRSDTVARWKDVGPPSSVVPSGPWMSGRKCSPTRSRARECDNSIRLTGKGDLEKSWSGTTAG